MSTVPVFSPDGTLGDVPYEQFLHAVRAGAKPGVNITAPDGSPGVVPADRVQDAVKAGAKVLPFEAQEVQHPGFWKSLTDDLKGMASGAYHAVTDYDPLTDPGVSDDAKWKIAEQQRQQAESKNQARTQQHGAAYSYGASAAEMAGANVTGMEKSAEEGDVAGVAGHAAAVPAVLAATEGVSQGLPAAAKAVGSAPVRSGIAKTARVASDIVDPEVTGIISPRAAHVQKALGRLADVLEKPKASAPSRSPLETMPAEDLEGVTSPQTESAASSPAEAEPEATPPPQSAAPPATAAKAPKSTGADLTQQLEDALGGKPLQKGVPLRNQGKAATLPEGFTSVDSTALRGYKYDPTKQEFESITNSGQHYVHGEVTPDQVAAFEAAKSKGQAWNTLRSSATPVAKVINGQRVPIKPTASRTVVIDPTTNQPEFSDVVSAKTGVPQEDLTDVLTEMLKQVKAQKAARATP